MEIIKTLKNKTIMRNIFRLAWPTMMEQVLYTFVSYADTAQVGAIGAEASAAVGLTSSSMWLINAPLFAFSMGILSVISRSIGSGDKETTKKAADQSVILAAALGLIIGLITLAVSPFLPVWLGAKEEIQASASIYFAIVCAPMLFKSASIVFGSVLRAVGDTKTPLFINTFMNLLNVALNFLLINKPNSYHLGSLELNIWGAGLGVTGAAIATAVSICLGGIAMTIAALRNPVLGIKLRKVRPDREILKQCISIGTPIAGERIAVSLGHVVFTGLVARLGTISVAAHSIAVTAEQAFYMPGYGMQTAAATLSGYAAGEKDEKKLRQYSSAIMLIAIALMGSLSLILLFFPEFMMSIFTNDQEVIQLGAKLLRIVSVSEPFFAAVIIMEGVFNGVGYTKMPFIYSVISMWGVRILFTFICVNVLGLGLTAVWFCMIADVIFRCLLYIFNYRSGKWLKHAINQN